MIQICVYEAAFVGGSGRKPARVCLQMPALYKTLRATVQSIQPLEVMSSTPGWRLCVHARVQDGSLQDRHFLVLRVGDQLPNVIPTRYDNANEPAAIQWSFWQGAYVPTFGGSIEVFDVTGFKLRGYDD